jgi:hypothetical protein
MLALATGLVALGCAARAQQPGAALPTVVVTGATPAPAPANAVPATLGTSRYVIGAERIEALPQGANAPLNQVLLQAPGVVQEAGGDIHVRGDHRNLQYRLNGIAIPETIGGFGPLLGARGLASVALLTGALPAQYGLRTAGVVELRLRQGADAPGGWAELYGGGPGLFQPSLSHGGSADGWSWFATGSMLRSDRGLESRTDSARNRHNATEQWRGLVTLEREIDQDTRASLILGGTNARYQIPVVPGQEPQFTVAGRPAPASEDIAAHQWNRGYFGVLTLQRQEGALRWQTAGFARFTSLHYRPDPLGDLAYTGAATDTYRRSLATGLQADAVWQASETHRIGFGTYLTRDATRSANRSTVLPVAEDGTVGETPFQIDEGDRRTSWLAGGYVQDHWRLSETLSANIGLRFDHMRQATAASQASPRANLVWRADATTTFTAGYARTFTPPPQELAVETNPLRYLGSTLAPEVLRADPVKPERAHYLNLGVNHRLNQRLTLGVELWYRRVGDMQDLGQFGSAYIFSPYNYREGRGLGSEFTATWRGEAVQLYANLALSRSEGRGLVSNQFFWTADEQAQVARKYVRTDHDQLVTASAGAAWEAWEGGRLSATMLYGSGLRRGFANSERGTPYATVNLSAGQRFTLPDGGDWRFRIDLLNALDRRYQLRDGTGIGVGAAQYGARRGVFFSLARAF